MSQTNSPELHVGSNVYTADGEKIGRLRFLMVDPETASVSHVVLEKGSYLNNDVMVPTDRVGQVLNRGIFLTATRAEIVEMEEFPESAYTGQRPERGERAERSEPQRPDRVERPERGHGGDRGDRGNSNGNGVRRNKRYRRN